MGKTGISSIQVYGRLQFSCQDFGMDDPVCLSTPRSFLVSKNVLLILKQPYYTKKFLYLLKTILNTSNVLLMKIISLFITRIHIFVVSETTSFLIIRVIKVTFNKMINDVRVFILCNYKSVSMNIMNRITCLRYQNINFFKNVFTYYML